MKALWLLAAVLLSGCAARGGPVAAAPDPVEAWRLERDAQREQLAALAAACQDSRCVETVAGYVAIVAVAGSGGGLPVQRREPTVIEQAVGVLGALAPIASTVAGYHTARHQTRAAVERDRIVWDGITGLAGEALGAMERVSVGAIPSVTIGGDWIGRDRVAVGGDVTGGDRIAIGDHYTGRDRLEVGGDQVGRDRVTVGGDQIGGDQQIGDRAGRDIVRGSPIRWYSPDHRDGDCRDGADCSGDGG